MPFSQDDKAFIKNLYLFRGYGSCRLLAKFPQNNWARRGIEKLLRKLRETGSTDRQRGSGRPQSTRTEENVATVEELPLSQEGQPQTHRSTCQISRETGISQCGADHSPRSRLKVR